MNFTEYEKLAKQTDLKTKIHGNDWLYYALGLSGEVGEISEKIKKAYRDNNGELNKEELIKEISDCLWYITILSSRFGYSLEDVAKINIKKLASRKDRNKVHGTGDDR